MSGTTSLPSSPGSNPGMREERVADPKSFNEGI
jgi:hypothetical protein